VILLTSCNIRDAEFDEFFNQDEQSNNSSEINDMNNGISEEHNNFDVPDDQETTLTILSYRDGDYFIQDFPGLFKKHHPHVNIVFEFYSVPQDTAAQLALTTRLLADPPDIFLFPSIVLNFEKLSMETLFLNYYELFDGPRGISVDDYFSNIYRASEIQGGLYSIPVFVELMLAYPNIRLFEGIDVDPSSISSVSVDDEIEFYTKISNAFPDERIRSSARFSIWRALTRNPLYDIKTGEVRADTPEMAERLRRAMEIPLTRDTVHLNIFYVEFKPEEIVENIIGSNTVATELLNESNIIFFDSADNPSWLLSALFLQEHPDIQFAKPVPFSFGKDSNRAFSSTHNLSIMKDSANRDLAWEFVRFIMEYEEARFLGSHNDHPYMTLPINKKAFDINTYEMMQFMFDYAMLFTDMEQHLEIPVEDFRAEQVENGLTYIRNIMERLNFEHRQNRAVLTSLVYPDVWLIHREEQTIEQGLANIQRRLELYVNE